MKHETKQRLLTIVLWVAPALHSVIIFLIQYYSEEPDYHHACTMSAVALFGYVIGYYFAKARKRAAQREEEQEEEY